MLTVKKLADALGVGPEVVRHYTEVGLVRPAVNSSTGYRRYSPEDGLVIGNARMLRSIDCSLSEIKAFHASALPEQIRRIDERRSGIAAEIETLKRKLARLDDVKAFLEKTVLCCGVVEDVRRPPIYRLCTFGNPKKDYTRERALAREWMTQLPYIHFTLKIPKEELGCPAFRGPYSAELGVGLTENYREATGLSVDPPVETVPAGRFLILYLTARDPLRLTPGDLRPLLDKAAELGIRFTHDSTGRLLALRETEEGTLFYLLIRVRIG